VSGTAIARRPGRVGRFWAAMPLGMRAAALVLVLTVLAGAFAQWLSPYDFRATHLRERLLPPFGFDGGTTKYVLGTDNLGRDILSRLLYATQISIALAFCGTLIAGLLGSVLGFVAAHRRGWVEDVILLLVDAQASLPFILIALAVMAFFGTDLWLFIALLGLNGWEKFARLVRGAVLSAKESGYAFAARGLGVSPWRLYSRHVLPNIANILIVQFTLNLPDTVLLETTLSFLGFGVQPPMTSLGQMLGAGRNHLLSAPWIALLPGAVIIGVTLSVSLLGDWLRDMLDPTSRNAD
jgi:peptide/nickel transport system permease protein